MHSKNKEVTFIILQKKHEVYALKWKNRRIGNRTRRIQMGCDFIEWNVETWTGWDVGDTPQPHFHGCWKIREQTRSWNHAEQKVEKKNCWHRLHQWAPSKQGSWSTAVTLSWWVCTSHTRNMRTTMSKRCTKLSRITCQTTKNAFLSLVEMSTLSWDQEKDRNVKVLANTHSTKATKEVIGWKVAWC